MTGPFRLDKIPIDPLTSDHDVSISAIDLERDIWARRPSSFQWDMSIGMSWLENLTSTKPRDVGSWITRWRHTCECDRIPNFRLTWSCYLNFSRGNWKRKKKRKKNQLKLMVRVRERVLSLFFPQQHSHHHCLLLTTPPIYHALNRKLSSRTHSLSLLRIISQFSLISWVHFTLPSSLY